MIIAEVADNMNLQETFEKYNDDLYYLRPINSFRKYTTNSDDEYLSLKFIPAQMSFKLFNKNFI